MQLIRFRWGSGITVMLSKFWMKEKRRPNLLLSIKLLTPPIAEASLYFSTVPPKSSLKS